MVAQIQGPKSWIELTLILESIMNEVARVARATMHHSDQPMDDLDRRTIYPVKAMCAIVVRLLCTMDQAMARMDDHLSYL